MSLQAFLEGMIATPDDRLRKADVARVASKHVVDERVAWLYLGHWLSRG